MNGTPDREKVIEALEACVLKDPDDSRDCKHCPRCNYGAFITNSCINGVMADALALLKAQEARMMTDSELMDAIQKAPIVQKPTVDAAPVKRGRWIDYPECLGYDGAYHDEHIVCSACHSVWNIIDNDADRFDYCPQCGARMGGEADG